LRAPHGHEQVALGGGEIVWSEARTQESVGSAGVDGEIAVL